MTEEKKLNLHEKLIEIRKGVEFVSKDKTSGNDPKYSYGYASGSAVLTPIRKKMDEYKVLLIPYIVSSNHSVIETRNKYEKIVLKDFVTLELMMTWVDAENPGDKIEIPFPAFGQQSDPSKAFGSALTYAERYFMLKFFQIPTDDIDPDGQQEKKPENKNKNSDFRKPAAENVQGSNNNGGTALFTEMQVKKFDAMTGKHPEIKEKIKTEFNVKHRNEFNKKDADKIYDRINKLKEEMANG